MTEVCFNNTCEIQRKQIQKRQEKCWMGEVAKMKSIKLSEALRKLEVQSAVVFAILTGVRGVCVLVGLAEHGSRRAIRRADPSVKALLPDTKKKKKNTNIYKHSSAPFPRLPW